MSLSQPVKMKICCSCLKSKELEKNFYRNKGMKDGRYGKCKMCLLKGLPCRKKEKPYKDKFVREEGLYLTGTRESDWIDMYEFLKQIGYQLDSTLSIHEQFCGKYKLKPKKRLFEKSKQFSPKDLGLV